MNTRVFLTFLVAVSVTLSAAEPSSVLPAAAVQQLASSLRAAARYDRHIWRDTPPTNSDGTVNAYIEIPRGERTKWEFDMGANRRGVDRVVAPQVGGYPVNYGFVPQTVSYDGDPFDVLVLGPPLTGGTLVRGAIVGLMDMVDEKGPDAKVVVTPLTPSGRPAYSLTPQDQDAMGRYFSTYKRYEPGKYSRVPGWDSADDGRAFVERTHAFFRQCQPGPGRQAGPCAVSAANPGR